MSEALKGAAKLAIDALARAHHEGGSGCDLCEARDALRRALGDLTVDCPRCHGRGWVNESTAGGDSSRGLGWGNITQTRCPDCAPPSSGGPKG